jgi:transcriptional regulator with XRE-family HTH domain
MRERLQELADFLKTRRSRLSAKDVGLPPGARRRTPGLRREEVAELAGISPTWYTWLEQARPVSVSPGTAKKICNALKLNASERRYLFELFEHPELIEYDADPLRVDDSFLEMLNSQNRPTYALNNRWDVVAWNRQADAIFRFSDVEREQDGVPPNLVRMTFLDKRIIEMSPRWEEDARELLARFRIDYSQHVERDEPVEQMVRTLEKESKNFRQWWQEHDVINPSGWMRTFSFDGIGAVTFRTELFQRPSTPFPRLVTYMLAPGAPKDALERICE